MAFIVLFFQVAHCLSTTNLPRDSSATNAGDKLQSMCDAAGENTYVAAQFGDDYYTTFDYNECYPYTIGGKVVQQALICKTVTCYNDANDDCTGGAIPPLPITVPAGLRLVNLADVAHLFGQSGICHAKILS
ncbi:hypothetical protein JR316_0006629 [Psilocybe cubensis]|nr:hypothetical protein JR316_0006629 [Psilocybe cubensis]KAH9480032.1 hypothetical protein JR316_0006629 [Psilocybe cubensis]